MFLFDSWTSTLLTCFLFSLIGYILTFRYLFKQLKFKFNIACCSAIVFITNGFWINHSMAGHINYCTFMLIPIIPYLIYSKWSNCKQIIVITLALTYSLYSGGSTFNMLFYLSFPLIYLLFKFTNFNIFKLKRIFLNIIIVHVLLIGISASKLISVSYLLENFSRLAEYSSWQLLSNFYPYKFVTVIYMEILISYREFFYQYQQIVSYFGSLEVVMNFGKMI